MNSVWPESSKSWPPALGANVVEFPNDNSKRFAFDVRKRSK